MITINNIAIITINIFASSPLPVLFKREMKNQLNALCVQNLSHLLISYNKYLICRFQVTINLSRLVTNKVERERHKILLNIVKALLKVGILL